MAAANAQIGVAKAAYFPLFNLFPSAGFESTTIVNWLSSPSAFALVGASAVATAFDAGRRRAASDQARAGYDQTVANYRQDVLTAYQEVEDNLAALRLLEDESSTEAAAVAAAEHSLALSNNRYRGWCDQLSRDYMCNLWRWRRTDGSAAFRSSHGSTACC